MDDTHNDPPGVFAAPGAEDLAGYVRPGDVTLPPDAASSPAVWGAPLVPDPPASPMALVNGQPVGTRRDLLLQRIRLMSGIDILTGGVDFDDVLPLTSARQVFHNEEVTVDELVAAFREALESDLVVYPDDLEPILAVYPDDLEPIDDPDIAEAAADPLDLHEIDNADDEPF